jgi:quercetin dioxygenase-like cupin family protein
MILCYLDHHQFKPRQCNNEEVFSMKSLRKISVLLILVAILAQFASAKTVHKPMPPSQQMGHSFVQLSDLKWVDAPSALPHGAKVAVLEGDPMAKGPFTMRVIFPAGYKIPPHWHSRDEHVTVLSGTLHMGIGDQFDETQGKTLEAGGFAVMHPGTKHFAWTTEETTIQLHGVGPWNIHYVNPLDDPRNHPAPSQQ